MSYDSSSLFHAWCSRIFDTHWQYACWQHYYSFYPKCRYSGCDLPATSPDFNAESHFHIPPLLTVPCISSHSHDGLDLAPLLPTITLLSPVVHIPSSPKLIPKPSNNQSLQNQSSQLFTTITHLPPKAKRGRIDSGWIIPKAGVTGKPWDLVAPW